MKRYIITESALKQLIEATHRLTAFEFGGVDNWEGYDWSKEDYLNSMNADSFEDLVEDDLEDYKVYEEI